MAAIKNIDRLDTALKAVLLGGFNRTAEQIRVRIERRIREVNKQFFRVMALKGIDVKGPDFGIFSRKWEPLNKDYTQRRKELHGVYKNRFYRYSGALSEALPRLRANGVFGQPSAALKVKRGNRIVSVNKKFTEDLKATISVDVYPKVDNLDSVQYDSYLPMKVAHKLANHRGKVQRPLLEPFMKWWLNVEIRRALKESVT